MTSGARGARVGVVFRGADPSAQPPPRLELMLAALIGAGLVVEAVPYVEGRPQALADRLSVAEGALVWVDPLSADGDRRALDEVLRAASLAGVWVSAHPDVIDRLGTKEVLVSTRDLSWGSDVHLYRTPKAFGEEFPARLAADGVRILKAGRGNGGRTVWKVRLADRPRGAGVRPDSEVVVQHAQVRDGSSTSMSLAALMGECLTMFDGWGGEGSLVDQEFIAGITGGIVRCYLVGGEVVGFARQYPEGARPLGPIEVDPTSGPSPRAVMGLPSPKTMYPPDEAAFSDLRQRLETEWVPRTTELLGLVPDDLPALWDVDLILDWDPGSSRGGRRFVLCEVNASSVIPFPPEAPGKLAAYVARSLGWRPD